MCKARHLSEDQIKVLYEKVRHYFLYKDGELIWNAPKKRATVGNIAGSIRPDGYKHIYLDQKAYFVHRLVWLYHTGEYSEIGLDHIDGNPLNNRIENLRVAEQWQNRGNTIGIKRDLPKGVYRLGGTHKYYSNFRSEYLGSYDSIEEAKAVYDEANKKYYREFTFNEDIRGAA